MVGWCKGCVCAGSSLSVYATCGVKYIDLYRFFAHNKSLIISTGQMYLYGVLYLYVHILLDNKYIEKTWEYYCDRP